MGSGREGNIMKLIWMTLAVMFLALPRLHAADYTFGSDNCDFQMVFPEKPVTTSRCNPEKPDQCYKVITFNRIFALDSGISVTVTCNPAEENMLQRYSGEVMEYTLQTMMDGGGDKADEQSSFDDYGDAKEATLLGQRTMPDGTDKIYMAQLWIGKNSVLTAQGEITGPASNEADTLFTNIMKSISLKSLANQDKDKKESAPVAEQKEPAEK
jgi:hypothetical protein